MRQEHDMTAFGDGARQALFDRSMELLHNGYSFIPFRLTPEGNKVPSIYTALAEYRERQPTEEEAFDWLEKPETSMIGVITGPISGHFTTLDFDHKEFFTLWSESAREVCRSYPAARKVVVEDTRKGVHVSFRTQPESQIISKREILAAYQSRKEPLITLPNGKQKPNIKVGIEVLAGGSASICSPSASGAYRMRAGRYDAMPVLDDEIVGFFLSIARGLDRRPDFLQGKGIKREFAASAYPEHVVRDSLIAAFNTRYNIREILVRNGYAMRANRLDFIRPGGSHETLQIAVGSGGYERVKALNTNDPLYTAPGDGAHDAFSCFCVLEHDGDQLAALRDARHILAQGG
jgi:hypothetical protein